MTLEAHLFILSLLLYYYLGSDDEINKNNDDASSHPPYSSTNQQEQYNQTTTESTELATADGEDEDEGRVPSNLSSVSVQHLPSFKRRDRSKEEDEQLEQVRQELRQKRQHNDDDERPDIPVDPQQGKQNNTLYSDSTVIVMFIYALTMIRSQMSFFFSSFFL